MRRIGLLGGMSSVEFAEIEELQRTGDWERAGEVLADAALD